ncbi:MAG: LysM peptidoglycan-binding domain-containing protein [Candidatus Methylacidiphilales bacterium]|nr:LysM peptidoglycan-binding domain-containing protein [Candidatus Methylacidiphilales bacterium]
MKSTMRACLYPGLFIVLAACSGPGATHQTSTPPPPVPASTGSSQPVIYDSPGGSSAQPDKLPLPAANTSSPTPSTAPASAAPSSVISYTVLPGDSLWKIANKHQTRVALIREANQLKDDIIRPGQVLQVPIP